MKVIQVSTTNPRFTKYNTVRGNLSENESQYKFYPDNPERINSGYTTSRVQKAGIVEDQFVLTTLNSVYTYEIM